MLLPPAGLAADGNPLPMRMGYLVGWTDLPGASLVIPAVDLLEYVSPYAYEQFEYTRWQERRREEKETEEKLRLAAEAGKAALESGQKLKLEPKVGRPKKKRGRARKKVEMRVDEAAIEEEVRKRAGSQVREGQPSLSTPQKGVFGGLAGGDEPGADAAIYRQLFGGEAEVDSEMSYPVTSEREGSRGYDSEPPRKRLRSSSPVKRGVYGGEEFAPSGMTPTPRAPSPTHGTSRPASKHDEASPMPTGFTPVIPFRRARQTRGTPPSPESREASVSSRPPAKPRATSKTPKRTPRKTAREAETDTPRNGAGAGNRPAEEPKEPQYEVKRLESAKQLMIDGRRERHFLVRWKGSWAPGENPTWEPEEFLPAKLVRKYLAKHPLVASAREEKVGSDVWPSRRYSSVTEAFEDPGGGGAANGVEEHDEDEDDDMEETFQVTEGAAAEKTKPSPELFGKALDFPFGKEYGTGYGTGGPS